MRVVFFSIMKTHSEGSHNLYYCMRSVQCSQSVHAEVEVEKAKGFSLVSPIFRISYMYVEYDAMVLFNPSI